MLLELQDALDELYSQASKAQDKLWDKEAAHWQKRENEEFDNSVAAGEAEYYEMQRVMEESGAEVARLEAELPGLTKQAAIQANKNATRSASSSYSYAVSRSAELLALYEELMEEKRIRDEAWAFQALIDAQWDAYDEVYEVYQNFESTQAGEYMKLNRMLESKDY